MPESEIAAVDARVTRLGEVLDRFARSREGIIDGPGVAHARRMLARAAALPDSVRGPLLDRVGASIDAVVARVEREQSRAQRRIEALAAEGADVTDLRTKLARGETRRVEHDYRRRVRLGRDARRTNPAITAKLESLARTNGIELDPDSPPSTFELASQLYERAAANASTAMLMDRVESAPRVDAGRYHDESVVASLLEAMRDASPTYLRAVLGRVEVLGRIDRFLEAFEPPPEPPKETKKSTKKRGRAKKSG